MTSTGGSVAGAAESAEDLVKAHELLYGKLVVFNSKLEARRFHWSEAGRNGMAVLRRCVYLQHTLKSWHDPADKATGKTGAGPLHSSGAARCVHLMQSQGDPAGACLVKAASAFLGAAWAELRHMALQELRAYVAVMQTFDQDGAGGEDACLRALLHMRRRCHVWEALRGAPVDLLGDVNEGLAEALSPEDLSQLRNAVSLLLESWQAGLAQVGSRMDAATRTAGGLNGEQCASWLLSWRLYHASHRHMAQQHLHRGPGHPRHPHLRAALEGGGTGSLAALQPRILLSSWVSMCAERAASLVQPFLSAQGAPAGGRVDPLDPGGWLASQEVLSQEVNGGLRALCPQLLLQLRDALAREELSEDDVERRLQLLSAAPATPAEQPSEPPPSATTTAATAPPPETLGPAPPLEPSPSQGGSLRPKLPQMALSAGPSGSGSPPLLDAGAGGAGGGGAASGLMEALVPAVDPQRASRLCHNPGQVALQHQLAAATKSGPDLPPASMEEATSRHSLGAALVYGICLHLHQTHSLLAAAHCGSTVSAPREQQTSRDRALQGGPGPEPLAPVLLVTQLPGDATNPLLEAAATAAGAAALSADGARLVVADGAKAAVALAAARATALVAASSSARSSGGGGAARVAGSGARPAVEAVDEQAEAAARGAAAWAQLIEGRVATELLPASAPGTAAAGPVAPGVEVVSEPAAAAAPADRVALLFAALLLSSGRVRLLAASLAVTGRPRAPVYRWADSSDPPGAVELPLRHTLPPLAALSGAAGGSGPSAALRESFLASPSARCSLLQGPVASCTAAANRLTHVANCHSAGVGADLKALCVAHSDAVTLGSAAESLLGVAQALSLLLWEPDQCAVTGTGSGSGSESQHAALDLWREGSSGGRAAADGAAAAVWARPTWQPPAGAEGTGRGPRLPRKVNWRRSLRRIMPSLSGRRSKGGGRVSDDGGGAGSGPAPGAGPGPPQAASRACWASSPMEPAPLPPLAPLCSIPRQETSESLQAGGKAQRRQPPNKVTKPAPAEADGRNASTAKKLQQLQQHPMFKGKGKVAAGVDGCARPSRFSGFQLPPAAAAEPLSQSRGEAGGPGAAPPPPVAPSAAEADLLCLLHSVCQQLHSAGARIADLLLAEMTSRISTFYCTTEGGAEASKARAAGVAVADSQSSTQHVVAKLLRPLCQALAGLHPTSQAQLLSGSFSAVLRVLRQQLSGGAGSDGAGFGIRRGAAGSRGAEWARRLDEDLGMLRSELTEAWGQVERAAAARGAHRGGGGKGAGVGAPRGRNSWSAEPPANLTAMRDELESQIRALRGALVARIAAAP